MRAYRTQQYTRVWGFVDTAAVPGIILLLYRSGKAARKILVFTAVCYKVQQQLTCCNSVCTYIYLYVIYSSTDEGQQSASLLLLLLQYLAVLRAVLYTHSVYR